MVPGDTDMNRARSANGGSALESAESAARAKLIEAIAETMDVRKLSQVEAAKLCRTDQPTLSKVLRGRTESVTIDKLVDWLLSLGRSVELRVGSTYSTGTAGLRVSVDRRSIRD
jgi:predicted XRE-type DNA-binding protein